MRTAWALSIAMLMCAASLNAGEPTRLVKSTPATGSIGASPNSILLEFSERVRFSRAFLTKDGGKAQAVGDLPTAVSSTQTIPLHGLSPGHYVLQWEAFTAHESIFSSRIEFTVTADSAAAASSP